jgi:hypothetical protein
MRRKRKFQEKRWRYALLISKNAATGLQYCCVPSLLTKKCEWWIDRKRRDIRIRYHSDKIKCTWQFFSLSKDFYICTSTLKEKIFSTTYSSYVIVLVGFMCVIVSCCRAKKVRSCLLCSFISFIYLRGYRSMYKEDIVTISRKKSCAAILIFSVKTM